MSIKAFHIFFNICAVLLSFVFAAWALVQGKNTGSQEYLIVGYFSVIVALGLLAYGVHFIRKARAVL